MVLLVPFAMRATCEGRRSYSTIVGPRSRPFSCCRVFLSLLCSIAAVGRSKRWLCTCVPHGMYACPSTDRQLLTHRRIGWPISSYARNAFSGSTFLSLWFVSAGCLRMFVHAMHIETRLGFYVFSSHSFVLLSLLTVAHRMDAILRGLIDVIHLFVCFCGVVALFSDFAC